MTPHPECGHDVNYGPDLTDVVCCVCDNNPCPRVTVELMREHRLFDIAAYSTREVSDAPF